MKKPAKSRSKSKPKSKGVTKVAPRKPAKAKPASPPIPLREGASIRMNLHDVIKVVKMIETRGYLREFTRRLKSKEAEVTVPADTVNLVKDFVVQKGMHTSAMGKHIAYGRGHTAPAGATMASRSVGGDDDQGRCHFGKAG